MHSDAQLRCIVQQVVGQIEPVEYAMRPAQHGFQKRFSLNISADGVPHDEDQQAGTTAPFLLDIHSWMLESICTQAQQRNLSGHAQTYHKVVKETIADFKAQHSGDLNEYWLAKLDFFKTDLLREASVNQRIIQFLVHKSSAVDKASEMSRTSFNVLEYALALRQWRRDQHMHHGFYTMIHKHVWTMPEERPKAKNLKKVNALPVDAQTEPDQLMGADVLKEALLTHPQSNVKFSNASATKWVRNRVSKAWLAVDKQRSAVDTALQDLSAHGLIQKAPEPAADAQHPREIERSGEMSKGKAPEQGKARGMAAKTVWYTKRSRAELEVDTKATAERMRLRVKIDMFPA